MTSQKPQSLVLVALAAAIGLAPGLARASWDVQVLPRAGSISPDGRHALMRLGMCDEGVGEPGPEVLVLIDVGDRTIRPLTHDDIHVSAASPDGSLVAFATSWGVFVAPPGAPAVGRTLQLHFLWGSTDDLAWRDAHALRVLGAYPDQNITDIDLETGVRRREEGPPNERWFRSFDASGKPSFDAPEVDASGRPVSRRAKDLPEVLPSASMLGWTADGRAILGHPGRRQYWLVTPDTGDVQVVDSHPGAVTVDPRLELRRRIVRCRHSFATDVWLHDGRPGGLPRLVYGFHGRFGGGVRTHADSVVTWTTELGVACAPS